MTNLMGLGVISFVIGIIGYLSWTRPKRSKAPTGYALGSIRGAQFAMGLGFALFTVGLIGAVVQAVL
jgi:hypothetical protein